MSPVDRDALVARLMVTFLDELDERVRVLNRDLLVLEREPHGDGRGEAITSLFRAAHSLKGAARSVSATAIEVTCHRLEDLLGQIRDGKIQLEVELLQQLFALVDTIAAAGKSARAARAGSASPGAVATPRPGAAPPGSAAALPPAGEGQRALPAALPRDEGAGFARVSAAKLDTLLDCGGELMVARRRVDDRTEDAIALHTAVARARRDFRLLARTLPRAVAATREATDEGGAPRARGGARSTDLSARSALLLRQTATRLRQLERDAERLAAAVVSDSRLLRQAAVPLEQEIHRVRMLPFSDACDGLLRTARDLAKSAGKEVELVVEHASVELDRSVLEKLKDPLLHLVRNAIDHGIEAPAERRAQGKPPTGRVTVSAALRGGSVQVEVADDGGGLDTATIREVARRRCLPTTDDERELSRLVFLPGFSTASGVTEVSGRGVGLDAVKSRLEALHGSVELWSERGRGARFTLIVPLTLTVVRVLLVRAREQTFAFVGASVRAVHRVSVERLCSIEGRDALLGGGAPVPVVALVDALGLRADDLGAAGEKLLLVVIRTGDHEVAFVVDELVAEQDVVVKSLGARLARVKHVAGATVLPTGRIALVLNSGELVRTALGAPSRRSLAARLTASASPPPKRLLVVDDSITTRALEKSILEGEGYQVTAASDGEEAWQILQASGADLVISDVEMPRMDGFTLTTTIRAAKRFRDLPIVLVTALESDGDRARGIAAGADAYLAKSAFDQRNLLEIIHQLL